MGCNAREVRCTSWIMEGAAVYLPMDRRQALARGKTLPERTRGAALFADISGFTPLTEALAWELGPQRGAEELAVHLNRVYDALIACLHRYGGSVISFGGDAITCWLDGDDGARATACALAMQAAMDSFAAVRTASGRTVALAMKVAVAQGAVRRFLVGDPECCLVEVLAGETLERLAAAEKLAGPGEVLLDREAATALGDGLRVQTWREATGKLLGEGEGGGGQRFAVADGLAIDVPERPWPPLPPGAPGDAQIHAWLLPAVHRRLASGQGEFLAELRPGIALFLRFSGIDYDGDPAASEKLDSFVRGVQQIVRRYEGSLLQLTTGDKGSYLYIAFGAPIAHEDDAARAARAALELQGLAAGLDYLNAVQIGITQGRMRTGAYGSRARRTYGVLGDAVNLAARLMSAAGPGQILAGERARAAAGETFAWQPLADLQVKGKAGAVAVSLLLGLKAGRDLRLLEPRYSLPMVGRAAELALIAEKVDRVLQGRGQIVGICGEAGLGKSRLLAEAVRLARERGLAAYGGECQSYGTRTSYLVWQRIWRELFGLDAAAPLDGQIATLADRLARVHPALVPRLPLLGPVLNLPIPDNDLTAGLDAKVRKASLEALLADCLAARSGEGPLLLVLEDCHWLDPLSHELVEVIGRVIAALPVLMLMAYRPPGEQRLTGVAQFTEVTLAEFTPQEAERLILLKLAQARGPELDVPSGFLSQISARAAGNPFYIEELLNYLRDRGIDPRDRQALAEVDLPGSLYSLVLSRIDRLTDSQQAVIKVASVIGRLFPAAMVWGVHRGLGSYQAVIADLQVLSELDLTPLDTPEPEVAYLFKHIITQEVAYESLLHATRAMLHEQIGRYLETNYGDRLGQYLNLLAFHYERSENEPKKREYLLRAGEAAQAGYANEAAAEYYRKVLPLVLEADQVTVMRRLGEVLELTGQWEEAGEQYRQALALARKLADREGQGWCELAAEELYRKRGDFLEATACLERSRSVFEGLADAEGIAQVLHYGGTLASQQGDYDKACTLYDESLAIRRSLGDELHAASLLSNLGIVARLQGDYALARSLNEEALAIRRESGDRWAIGVSLNNLGNVALDQGHLAEARALHEEGLAMRREVGDPWAIANALNNLANLARTQGDYEEACGLYRESLVTYRVLGDRWALAYLFEDVGCLAALRGYPARALRLAGAASVLREEIGAPLSAAERTKLEEGLAPARQALGEEEAAAAQAEGRGLTPEAAIELALADL